VVGPYGGAVSFPPRADTGAGRFSVRPQTLRDHAGLGDGSVDARYRALGRVRRRLAAIPKVVFSRTLDSAQGNARLAEASLAGEATAALDATDKDVAIGGAGLAAAAIELGLVDELRMFRNPVVVGDGTPFLPPVTDDGRLELVETRTFGSRVIYERYVRARDESA
jgi:dihydrofolate reductase